MIWYDFIRTKSRPELQCTESMKYIENKTQNGKRRNKAQHETTQKHKEKHKQIECKNKNEKELKQNLFYETGIFLQTMFHKQWLLLIGLIYSKTT